MRGLTLRRVSAVVTVLTGVIAMATPAVANAPEGGVHPGTVITVLPSDNLPGDAVVVVSGTGFPAGAAVVIAQCRGSVLNCGDAFATTGADATGRFSPVTLRVSDFVRGDLCQVRNDCFVAAMGSRSAFPDVVSREARHHLSFAPRPLSLLDELLELLGLRLRL